MYKRQPLRRVARETGTSKSTVSRIVQEAGGRSLRLLKRPLVSERDQNVRVERYTRLLNDLKSAPPHRIIFFSDEKTFDVDPHHNPQNDRFVRLPAAAAGGGAGDPFGAVHGEKYITSTKHPASLMFLGVVASTGEVGPVIWFAEGYRLNAEGYVNVLRTKIVPWMRQISHNHACSFVFQQDSAPAHIAKATTAFLNEENVPFWPRSYWPPNSPDLAPLDYGIWPMVVQGACRSRSPNVSVLHRRVNATWRSLDPASVRAVCRSFRKKIEKTIELNGKTF